MRVIAVYEDSVEKPAFERFVTVDDEGRLFESAPIAALPNSAAVIEAYAERCREYLRYGLDLEACLRRDLGRYSPVVVRCDTPRVRGGFVVRKPRVFY